MRKRIVEPHCYHNQNGTQAVQSCTTVDVYAKSKEGINMYPDYYKRQREPPRRAISRSKQMVITQHQILETCNLDYKTYSRKKMNQFLNFSSTTERNINN